MAFWTWLCVEQKPLDVQIAVARSGVVLLAEGALCTTCIVVEGSLAARSAPVCGAEGTFAGKEVDVSELQSLPFERCAFKGGDQP